MRGHFLSQTRRLNRHYQSGGGAGYPNPLDPAHWTLRVSHNASVRRASASPGTDTENFHWSAGSVWGVGVGDAVVIDFNQYNGVIDFSLTGSLSIRFDTTNGSSSTSRTATIPAFDPTEPRWMPHSATITDADSNSYIIEWVWVDYKTIRLTGTAVENIRGWRLTFSYNFDDTASHSTAYFHVLYSIYDGV